MIDLKQTAAMLAERIVTLINAEGTAWSNTEENFMERLIVPLIEAALREAVDKARIDERQKFPCCCEAERKCDCKEQTRLEERERLAKFFETCDTQRFGAISDMDAIAQAIREGEK